MLGIFGQHQQAFHAVWVANSGSVGRGMPFNKLAPEQIAVFAADEYCTKEVPTSLATPSFKKSKRLVLKMGLHPFKGQQSPALSRQTKKSRTTFEFEAEDVVSFTGFKSKIKNSTEVVAIGYDGLDASKTLSDMMNAKPMRVNLILSGEPIQRTFGKNRVEHALILDKGLCVGDCDCYDACGKVKCDVIADQIVKLVTEQTLFVPASDGRMLQAPLKNFIKANKIVKCSTAAVAPDLIEYVKYEITICDDGSTTIAQLQNTYKDAKISLESRVNGHSTYSMWVAKDATAPTDFTMVDYITPICDVCPDCPVDATQVDGLKVIQVTVACGAAAPAVTDAVSTTKMSSTLQGGDVYIVKVPLTTTDEDIETELDALACIDYAIIGSEGVSCILPAKTFTWAQCENCFKTEKDFQIILPDANCEAGISRLADLQAAYPELVVTEESAGNCSRLYKTTVESDCVKQEDCGRLVNYEFKAPAGYDGFQWTDVKAVLATPSCDIPTPAVEPCCVCGVIFETAVWNEDAPGECEYGWYEYHPNNKKPVRLQVNIESYDYSDNPCNVTSTYSTILRKLELDVSAPGTFVYEVERNFLLYENKSWEASPYYQDLVGFKPHAKQHKMYDQYVLRLKRRGLDSNYLGNKQTFMDYVFYVETGAGKEFENFMNELVLSTGNPKIKAVVL